MNRKAIHYMVRAHSCSGHVELCASNLKGIEHTLVLTGSTSSGRSAILEQIASSLDTNTEFLHDPNDTALLDGLLFPGKKLAVLSDMYPTGSGMRWLPIGPQQSMTGPQAQALTETFRAAYDGFAQGKVIHDEWEKLYIDHFSFEKADAFAQTAIDIIIGDQSGEEPGEERHRFFGGATPVGTRDFVPQLIEPLKKRIFLKGRPGTGKSTLLKKVLKAATDRGFNTEVYHCGFDPGSLDMILIPALSACIFDSTLPHEYFPMRDDDAILDIYDACKTLGVDETFHDQLEDIRARYSAAVKGGILRLSQAKALLDVFESAGADPMEGAAASVLDIIETL